MASPREMHRKDGTGYVKVLYPLGGKQASTSFEDPNRRSSSRSWQTGSACQALEVIGSDPELSTTTPEKWLEHHIAHLTGLRLA
jgi:hypothetical protein